MLTRRMMPVFQAADFDRLFEDFFTTPQGPWGGSAAVAFPAMNVWEDKDNVVVEAELPGFKLQDIDITLHGDELTIAGRRETVDKTEGATWRRRERISGTFSRSVRLPFEVNAEKVDAAMNHGVLTITLPKSETVRSRKIAVRGA